MKIVVYGTLLLALGSVLLAEAATPERRVPKGDKDGKDRRSGTDRRGDGTWWDKPASDPSKLIDQKKVITGEAERQMKPVDERRNGADRRTGGFNWWGSPSERRDALDHKNVVGPIFTEKTSPSPKSDPKSNATGGAGASSRTKSSSGSSAPPAGPKPGGSTPSLGK